MKNILNNKHQNMINRINNEARTQHIVNLKSFLTSSNILGSLQKNQRAKIERKKRIR